MKLVFKKMLFSLLLATMLMGIVQSAVADTSLAGMAIDAIIPACEELLTGLLEVFDANDFKISTEEFIGKKGTIYFNFDKNKVLMSGEEKYRTYEFTDEDYFELFVACTCAAIDMNDELLDLGVKLYWVKNNETELLGADEISQVGALLATMLQ